MEGYLGETILDIHKTEYAMYAPQDWVMLWKIGRASCRERV